MGKRRKDGRGGSGMGGLTETRTDSLYLGHIRRSTERAEKPPRRGRGGRCELRNGMARRGDEGERDLVSRPGDWVRNGEIAFRTVCFITL
jgi:hypothetical protein